MTRTTTQTEVKKERDVPREERANLIASDKVEETAVYGADRKKIGRIENLMIDKFAGQVAYAVLSFGGLFGAGSEHYPIPWAMLKYDEELGGYLPPIIQEYFKQTPQKGPERTLEGGQPEAALFQDSFTLG